MATTSSDRGFSVPVVSSDSGLWGGELNATIAAVDSILGGTLILQSSTYGTATTLTSSMAQVGRIVIAGSLSTTFVLTLPASNFAYGNYNIVNQSSAGGYGVQCQTLGGGTTVTIPSSTARIINVDGSNATFPDTTPVSAFPNPAVGIDMCISGGGVTPSAGWYGLIEVPFSFTASSYQIYSGTDTPGSAAVNIYQYPGGYSGYPGNQTYLSTLTLSGAYKNGGGFGVSFSPGDLIGFVLNSATTLTVVNVSINGTRSLSS